MSDTEFNVVIAAYLIPDLAQQDFDARQARRGQAAHGGRRGAGHQRRRR